MPPRLLLPRLAALLCCLAAGAAPATTQADALAITPLQRHEGAREYRFPTVQGFRPAVTARINYQLFAAAFPPESYGLPPANPGDSLKLAALDRPGASPLVRLDYRVLRNDGRVFAVELAGESCSPACLAFSQPVAFDSTTGRRLTPRDLFTADGHAALVAHMSARQRAALEREIAIRRQPGARQDDDARATLALYEQCLATRYAGRDWPAPGDMAVDAEHVTFSHGACSTAATRTLDELGPLRERYTLNQLRPWLSAYGRAVLLGERPVAATSVQGQLLAGTLGKEGLHLHLVPAPLNALARNGDAVSAYYLRDRERQYLPLRGRWQDGVLTLQEFRDEQVGATLTLRLRDGGFNGTWRSADGQRTLPVRLAIP